MEGKIILDLLIRIKYAVIILIYLYYMKLEQNNINRLTIDNLNINSLSSKSEQLKISRKSWYFNNQRLNLMKVDLTVDKLDSPWPVCYKWVFKTLKTWQNSKLGWSDIPKSIYQLPYLLSSYFSNNFSYLHRMKDC